MGSIDSFNTSSFWDRFRTSEIVIQTLLSRLSNWLLNQKFWFNLNHSSVLNFNSWKPNLDFKLKFSTWKLNTMLTQRTMIDRWRYSGTFFTEHRVVYNQDADQTVSNWSFKGRDLITQWDSHMSLHFSHLVRKSFRSLSLSFVDWKIFSSNCNSQIQMRWLTCCCRNSLVIH